MLWKGGGGMGGKLGNGEKQGGKNPLGLQGTKKIDRKVT